MKYEDTKIIYEVGDWVFLDLASTDWIFRIQSIEKNDKVNADIVNMNGNDYNGDWSGTVRGKFSLSSNAIRPATEAEVKLAMSRYSENITVGSHKVCFNTVAGTEDVESLQIGCVNVTKEKFIRIGVRAGWL